MTLALRRVELGAGKTVSGFEATTTWGEKH
jgi:hypothetical protein